MLQPNTGGSGLSITKEVVGKLDFDEEIKKLKKLIRDNSKSTDQRSDECFKQVLSSIQNFRRCFKDEIAKLHDETINFSRDLSNKQIDNVKREVDELAKIIASLNLKEDLKKLEVLKELESLKQLKELENLSGLENLEFLGNLAKLDELDKLTDLKKLKELKNLEMLSDILNRLGDLQGALQYFQSSKNWKNLKKLEGLDHLNQLASLDELKNLDILSELDNLSSLKNLSKLGDLSTIKSEIADLRDNQEEILDILKDMNKKPKKKKEKIVKSEPVHKEEIRKVESYKDLKILPLDVVKAIVTKRNLIHRAGIYERITLDKWRRVK
jgi:hypothetical protein